MTAIDAPAPATAHRGPAFGFTKLGHPVHARVFDHLPTGTPYARFNKHLAVWITNNVGTMTCFWMFCVVLLPSLMVGQNLQNLAADARSAKTFEDVERIIDLLDYHTGGGLQVVVDAVAELKREIASTRGPA